MIQQFSLDSLGAVVVKMYLSFHWLYDSMIGLEILWQTHLGMFSCGDGRSYVTFATHDLKLENNME